MTQVNYPKCSTCLHWTPRTGWCSQIEIQEGKHTGPITGATVSVTVADDWNLEVSIKTAPDFGCNLHSDLRST